jgi:hypothetical protein
MAIIVSELLLTGIESKGMTHRDLKLLAPNDLEFEIARSKQCLENHGINSPNILQSYMLMRGLIQLL